MKFYAALLFSLFFLVASHQVFESAQAQYNLSVDEMMDRKMSGVPILDPKLSLLIRDVDMANWRAVDYHNKKIVPAVKKSPSVNQEWLIEHSLLVAKWTAWDHILQEWYVKKKVEASASMAVSGGGIKVRNMDAIQTQNETLGIWRMTKNQVEEITEKEELMEEMGDLSELWSEFAGRVKTLDKAINSLRKY